ncbi:MAG: hypothetical protein WC284_14445 [Candidimonas sp.]
MRIYEVTRYKNFKNQKYFTFDAIVDRSTEKSLKLSIPSLGNRVMFIGWKLIRDYGNYRNVGDTEDGKSIFRITIPHGIAKKEGILDAKTMDNISLDNEKHAYTDDEKTKLSELASQVWEIYEQSEKFKPKTLSSSERYDRMQQVHRFVDTDAGSFDLNFATEEDAKISMIKTQIKYMADTAKNEADRTHEHLGLSTVEKILNDAKKLFKELTDLDNILKKRKSSNQNISD